MSAANPVQAGKARRSVVSHRRSAGVIVAFCCHLLLLSQAGSAAPIITFDQFADGQVLSTQIPGLTFTNATILTAGISLNELEYPPRSNPNVAGDTGGPISISFTSPVSFFSGFFTYSEPLILDAFSGNALITQATSVFSSNLALSGASGSSPNELIQLASTSGFTLVTITGSATGASFVMDDLSFQTVQNVPEGGTRLLLCIGMLSLAPLVLQKKG